MDDLIIVLALVALAGLIVGLSNPSLISRVIKKHLTRKQTGLIFGGAFIVLIFIGGIMAYIVETEPTPEPNEKEGEKVTEGPAEAEIEEEAEVETEETESQKYLVDNVTQDWVTYNNDEYNFSFKYPKYCEIQLKYNTTFSFECERQKDSSDFAVDYLLTFTPEHNNLSFDEYLLKERNSCLQWLNDFNSDDKDVEEMITVKTINIMKAISNVSGCGHNVGSPNEIWLFNRDEDVVVHFVEGIYVDDWETSNKIIESFEFIE